MIFVIAGTSEGRFIIDSLLQMKLKVLASVTTDFAGSLLGQKERLEVITQKLTKNDFIAIIQKNSIDLIIDASHPFAVEVSKNVITAAKETDCKYIRFERKSPLYKNEYDKIIEVENFDEAVKVVSDKEGNIFLTIGSKELGKFVTQINPQRLYARVLPMSDVLKKCEDLGFSPSNIIAMKGPFSKGLDVEMIKTTNAKIMITKESGDAGGFMEKVEAASELDILLIVIKREILEYPLLVNDMNKLIKYVEEHYEN